MGYESIPPSAYEALSPQLRPHAERWALQLLEVPDEDVPQILEKLLRNVFDAVDPEFARDNVDDVKQWLRLVGHAIVERRQELRKKTCGNKGRA